MVIFLAIYFFLAATLAAFVNVYSRTAEDDEVKSLNSLHFILLALGVSFTYAVVWPIFWYAQIVKVRQEKAKADLEKLIDQ